jgi:HTH-type transcriptional regulator/antitoxin HigA
MAKIISDIRPVTATHPGEVLKDELDARNIKQKEFAAELNIGVTQLNEIINGKRSITPDFALMLESMLGIDAKFWVNMQANYNLDTARLKKENIEKRQILERWQVLKNYVDTNFYRKIGLIEGNPLVDEKTIQRIYREGDIDGIVNTVTQYSYSYFRRSEALNTNRINLISWVKIVEYKSDNLDVAKFEYQNIEPLMIDLKKSFAEYNVLTSITSLMKQAGIKLVILENPKEVPVDGMSFWSGKNPAIGLSLRHNRLDNLAFTLFHELGHIYLHMRDNRNEKFIHNIEDALVSKESLEKAANEFAANNLIDPLVWKEMVTTCFNFTDGVVESFAKKAKINPAIMRGRICYEFNQYFKVKTRINNEIK